MSKEVEYFNITDIFEEFNKASSSKRIHWLWEALDYMEQYNGRGKDMCLALAMGYKNYEGKADTYYK